MNKIKLRLITLKRVHTEVIDSSSDEELIRNYVKKSKVISLKAWTKFLVIGSADDETLNKLSPFPIQKGLHGSLLVECSTESHSKNLLKSKRLCGILLTVNPHNYLNSSKGVIRLKIWKVLVRKRFAIICPHRGSHPSSVNRYAGTMNLLRQTPLF